MNVGVLIPPDDPVRLPVFVLKRLDLNPLYEAYNAYREKQRREQAGREREAVERGAGKLIEAERKDTRPDRHRAVWRYGGRTLTGMRKGGKKRFG
jgi:hypothetical protein